MVPPFRHLSRQPLIRFRGGKPNVHLAGCTYPSQLCTAYPRIPDFSSIRRIRGAVAAFFSILKAEELSSQSPLRIVSLQPLPTRELIPLQNELLPTYRAQLTRDFRKLAPLLA